MPSTYKTPGVYIEEITTLPASIAQVETAIPAFVGYTEKAKKDGKPVEDKPTRITSLLEFEAYFGKGPDKLEIKVELNSDNSVSTVEVGSKFCLYDSIRMFYANGGGPCYIVSVGDFSEQDTADYFTDLEEGLTTLRKEDEPTLILFPDAANLFGTADGANDKVNLGNLQKAALKQCNDLQDRFCIFDIADGDTELNLADDDSKTPDLAFRDNIGVQYLKYGASYYPYLKTSLSFDFGYNDFKDGITKKGAAVTLGALSTDATFVENLEKVLTDKGNFELFVYGDPSSDDEIDFSSTTLLDVERIKTVDIYSGYDLISEEYSDLSTVAKVEKQIKARIEYIWFMLSKFISLSVTDNADEDNNAATSGFLLAEHNKLTDVTNSIVYDLIKKLYFYDYGYSRSGNAAAVADLAPFDVLGRVITDEGTPSEKITVTVNGKEYDLTTVVIDDDTLDNSIYGTITGSTAVEKATEANTNSKSAHQELYEEVASLFKSFEAEIDLRVDGLQDLLEETNSVYASIVKAVKKEGIVLPPSGAVAGVYAATDNERGVWVAPANRSLSGVVGPKINITAEEQGGLNVDPTAGKSINAIRSFTGKGTLIWGARTLAGNSSEWRYVPVRRLFNMIEESVKKATEFVVFEPNDKNTWVRTKAMIENFLNQIWKAGGLAGAKAEHAYIVKVGLGETMTAQDILDGKMIVEIHLAAVRPAEFIILRFMHKLQES